MAGSTATKFLVLDLVLLMFSRGVAKNMFAMLGTTTRVGKHTTRLSAGILLQ